jgi:hypothetical protein
VRLAEFLGTAAAVGRCDRGRYVSVLRESIDKAVHLCTLLHAIVTRTALNGMRLAAAAFVQESTEEDSGASRTRQRRAIHKERKTPKMGEFSTEACGGSTVLQITVFTFRCGHCVMAGNWWRNLGYGGPPYCQRCSEVFRDHIMRQ